MHQGAAMADAEITHRVVSQFWAAMQANDWAAAAALFADDYVLAWPQSGERICGSANFVAINSAYPAAGAWRFTVERLLVEGEQAVTDVVVSDGAVTARAITFTTVCEGRIASQVEYWPDPFEAPAWRAAWTERAAEQPGASPAA
jgi:ketosteroid isomerase-like protein